MYMYEKAKNLVKMCELAESMKDALENNDLTCFGEILNENWKLKKQLASGISNENIDKSYNIALENGALGGKLLGAGGGGFLLLYCEKNKQEDLKKALNLKNMEFRFEHDGTSVVFLGDKYW